MLAVGPRHGEIIIITIIVTIITVITFVVAAVDIIVVVVEVVVVELDNVVRPEMMGHKDPVVHVGNAISVVALVITKTLL